MPSTQEVSSFIQGTFRSVWALELLCYLRNHRERSLSQAEMVTGMRSSDLVVSQSVDNLAAAGLIVLEQGGEARYNPASPDLDALVAQTEALYGKSPDAVRRMIIASSAPTITAFAESFKLRKD